MSSRPQTRDVVRASSTAPAIHLPSGPLPDGRGSEGVLDSAGRTTKPCRSPLGTPTEPRPSGSGPLGTTIGEAAFRLAVPKGNGAHELRERHLTTAVAATAGQTLLASRLLPLRDAALATLALIAAVVAGSGGGEWLDPALFGYLGATLVAAFALAWRASAFWRRPASAFYGRALLRSLREPRRLRRSAAFAGRDLAAQEFIRRRSPLRWLAHLLLSLGTLASFAITVPLVCGWMRFSPAGDGTYRLIVFAVPTLVFSVEGAFAWLLFHALALSAIAVVIGAGVFLALRLRARRLPGVAESFAIAPLLLLLAVALTGLALPASRGWPAAFHLAATVHEISVVVLLMALPFSKLAHVLVRPLQLGARAVRDPREPWRRCRGCGGALAPGAQHAAVASLLARRGLAAGHLDRCPSCRRRGLAVAQARLVDSSFQASAAGRAQSVLQEAVREADPAGRGRPALRTREIG